MGKQYQWIKVADDLADLQFASNQVAMAELNGTPICIGRYRDQLFAFAAKCPHAGGLLSEGRIDAAGNIICPLHGYRFAIRNGCNMSGEGYYLRHWPVEIKDNGVYVGVVFT
ncbi:Rieske (2Fe-2S) protein [Flavihumibacter solisilvae]|uniref:Rieske domain-containing protein n=1 Tax=Flavihumibacter solisilvae TaxID=1349421 RepID=A0A0C1IKY7_9BACT|nr:Rieske 2Fe-2S domain-containing protein [Flavihumibacter solisilvae]KIC94835.1 hypothetical protein OI18_10290 [Flavihumibacter solisilvae]